MITQRQIEILQHTLGVNESRREPYRNYYVAGPQYGYVSSYKTHKVRADALRRPPRWR